MDPFQIKYGNVLSGALVLPALLGDILWVSCTLLGLGEHTYTDACVREYNQTITRGIIIIILFICLFIIYLFLL